MKYSESCLWKAVYVFCANYEVARAAGVHLTLPEAIKRAAELAFMEYETVEYKTSIKQHVGTILREALYEMNTVGSVTFGEQDEFVVAGSEDGKFVVFGSDATDRKFPCCFDGEATVWFTSNLTTAKCLADELKDSYPLTEYFVEDIAGKIVYVSLHKKD